MTAHRRVMRELVSAAGGTASIDAALAARVAAIDPAAIELQQAAVAIRLGTRRERRSGRSPARCAAITAHACERASSAPSVFVVCPRGSLADELRRKE